MPNDRNSEFKRRILSNESNIDHVVCKRRLQKRSWNSWIFSLVVTLFLYVPASAMNSDGEALISFKRGIQNANSSLQSWNESHPNPCLWSGVTCLPGSDRVHRLNIPHLNLRGFISPQLGKLDQLRRLGIHENNLYGSIPREISNCTNLRALYLRGNFLTGNIPEELGNLQRLKTLDISNNGLTGSIPESLGRLSQLSFLNVSANFLVGNIPTLGVLAKFGKSSFSSNPNICGTQVDVVCKSVPPNSATTWTKDSTIVGRSTGDDNSILMSAIGTAGIALLVALICCLAFLVFKKHRSNLLQEIPDDSLDGYKLVMFRSDGPYTTDEVYKRIESLRAADIIGSGSFGTVYRLVMDDGGMFAVKSVLKQEMGSERLFEKELEILGNLKHRNLVNLCGYYISSSARLLIYDFLPGGNLDDNLHERSLTKKQLTWSTRLRIAIGSARGIAYMHNDCVPGVIHRGIKSSNVLLDNDMEPYVSDFGLAKLVEDDSSHVTTIIAGTFGYLAPEYMESGAATEKGDVYSFGVMLLELISGKRPTDALLIKNGFNLVTWASYCMKFNQIEELVEENCLEEISIDQIQPIIQIALHCVSPVPEDRPTMDKVVQSLETHKISRCTSDLSNFGHSPIFACEERGR